MIAEAIDQDWFTADDLNDERFVVAGVEERKETTEQALDRLKREIDSNFNRNTPMSALDKLFEQLAEVDAPPALRVEMIEAVCDKMEVKQKGERLKITRIHDRIFKKVSERSERSKTAEAQSKAIAEKVKNSGGKPMLAPKTRGFMPCVEDAFKRLVEINVTDQCYYSIGGQKVVIHKDATGKIESIPLGLREMVSELNHTCVWVEETKDDLIPIECPVGVASDVITYRKYDFPRLNRITSMPFFTADGELIVKEGYHQKSGIYYAPAPGFHVPEIPQNPTNEEVAEAVKLINEGLLGDFPFNDADGKNGMSSRAHANALLFERFAREMIDGFVPIYMVDKTSGRHRRHEAG